MVLLVRVTYHVLRLYVCPPIQEEGDGSMVTLGSSLMEGGRSILQQGHTMRMNMVETPSRDDSSFSSSERETYLTY